MRLMNTLRISIGLLLVFLASNVLMAQRNAEPWVSYPTANTTGYGVYHFRKTFVLEEKPAELLVHISADNRYELFVNGQRACFGPAKGDLKTYKYDVLDLAPFLEKGKNVIAAMVFNMGKDKPMAFISAQTAFLFRSEDPAFRFINSDQGWKAYRNEAYDPILYQELDTRAWVKGYYACGPGDEVFGERYPWGWETLAFDDNSWVVPEVLDFQGRAPWNLMPRNIPFMDTHMEAPQSIRRATGLMVPGGFLKGHAVLTVPAQARASVLFDYGVFTMGYPELTVDQGAGSTLKVRYAEALYEAPNLKGHRDSVDNLTMYGVFDIFHTDGAKRTFRPIWKRAFRYVEVEISTGDEPLQLLALRSQYSGYPYPDMGTFESNDPQLNELFEMGLRTLRMCSGETYYDTPYYEQLSYGGDNRPIASISFYNSTDDRLFREMMRLYPQSANTETRLFKSAYPSRFNFDQGTWSLAWVQSLWDYFAFRGDTAFVQQLAEPIEGVLNFYLYNLDESMGLLGPIHTRNFMDWSMHKGTVPQPKPRVVLRHSAMLTLYYAHTLDCAVRLYQMLGEEEKARAWEQVAAKIKTAVFIHCWDEEKQLMADFPDKNQFSQHTNILAILCDAVAPVSQPALFDRVVSYEHFDERASSYFSFFLFKAMQKAGRAHLFLEHLGFWEAFLDKGFTTFGETGFASHDRSDCHAWSAHPSYYLLSLVCGIQPADMGFNRVRIAPNLNGLQEVSASMPHPKGRIQVHYQVVDDRLRAEIILPKGLSGDWRFGAEHMQLSSGVNRIETLL